MLLRSRIIHFRTEEMDDAFLWPANIVLNR
jgi:hypothetical protein